MSLIPRPNLTTGNCTHLQLLWVLKVVSECTFMEKVIPNVYFASAAQVQKLCAQMASRPVHGRLEGQVLKLEKGLKPQNPRPNNACGRSTPALCVCVCVRVCVAHVVFAFDESRAEHASDQPERN